MSSHRWPIRPPRCQHPTGLVLIQGHPTSPDALTFPGAATIAPQKYRLQSVVPDGNPARPVDDTVDRRLGLILVRITDTFRKLLIHDFPPPPDSRSISTNSSRDSAISANDRLILASTSVIPIPIPPMASVSPNPIAYHPLIQRSERFLGVHPSRFRPSSTAGLPGWHR